MTLMQQYLNAIARVYPSIPTLATDGVFGPRTQDAVRAFQRLFGVADDGVIGPGTWDAIVAQFNYVQTAAPRKVVLDPGHGGADPGAVNGTRLEKDDNLALAQAVRDRLLDMGVNVIMTRYSDVFVPLAERSAVSNRNHADLLVSLHRNASVNSSANGLELYVYNNAGTNTVTYAQNILQQIADAGTQNNRGLKQGDYSILRNTRAPAVLVELGFISNAVDNQFFDENFDAYADAIAQGIYESLYGTAATLPPHFNYVVQSGETMWQIAQRFNSTVEAIMALNSLTTDEVSAGQILMVPSAA